MARAALALCLALALFAVPRATPAQSAAQPATLKVGLIMTFSGPGSALARSINATIAAYFAVNGERLGGRPVTIIRRDDTHTPENARRLAQELIVQDKIDVLMGGTSSPEAIAIGSVSTQAKIPYFIINSTAPGIIAKAPYATSTSFLATDLAPPMARWAVRSGIKSMYAVVADYSSGAQTLAAITDAMAAAGGKVVGSVPVPLQTTDFSSYLLRVKDAKPDAVFAFVGGGPSSINVVKQFNTAGLKASMKLTGTADLISEELLAAEGDDAAGAVTVSNYTAEHDSKLNRDFVRAFRAALPNATPEDAPSFMDVQTWDALSLIDRVVAAQKGALDPDRTMEILRGIKLESPRGTISFDPLTREVHQSMYIRRVQKRDNRYVNAEIAEFPPGK